MRKSLNPKRSPNVQIARENGHVSARYNPKATNPKDDIGSKKLPIGLQPETIDGEVALAYLEGALKYGRYNWRIAGVRSSIYYAALRRHLARWWNGENRDKKTRVKHLASVIACAGIILDAELCGKLNDDRPPSVDLDKLLNVDDHVAFLVDMFKDHDPHQYTIADSEADAMRMVLENAGFHAHAALVPAGTRKKRTTAERRRVALRNLAQGKRRRKR